MDNRPRRQSRENSFLSAESSASVLGHRRSEDPIQEDEKLTELAREAVKNLEDVKESVIPEEKGSIIVNSLPVEDKINASEENSPEDEKEELVIEEVKTTKKEKKTKVKKTEGVIELTGEDLLELFTRQDDKLRGINKCTYFDKDIYEAVTEMSNKYKVSFSKIINYLVRLGIDSKR